MFCIKCGIIVTKYNISDSGKFGTFLPLSEIKIGEDIYGEQYQTLQSQSELLVMLEMSKVENSIPKLPFIVRWEDGKKGFRIYNYDPENGAIVVAIGNPPVIKGWISIADAKRLRRNEELPYIH